MEKNQTNNKEKKEEVVEIKEKYIYYGILVALLAIIFLLIFFALRNSTQPSAEDYFVKYAKDLKLDMQKFEYCLDNDKMAGDVEKDYQRGLELNVSGTPSFVINGNPYFIGAASYEQFKAIIDEELQHPPVYKYETGISKGSISAPIAMVEYGDFQCPFCRRFWAETLPQIQKDYIDTGKVLFIYKHFPLSSIHPYAQKAAEASECAGMQGKFWEFHDTLYKKQNEWSK